MANKIVEFGILFPPMRPTFDRVYAFEMSDGTTKIGMSSDVEKRVKSVERATRLSVLRVHSTEPAPLELIRKVEASCHARFAERRVHGEFFDITFAEACAELELYAADLAGAAEQAEADYRRNAAQFREAVDYIKVVCEYRQLHAACEKLNDYSRARGEYDDLSEFDIKPEEITADSWWEMYERMADEAAGVTERRFSLIIPPELIAAEECDEIICRVIEEGMADRKNHHEIYEDCKAKLAEWSALTK